MKVDAKQSGVLVTSEPWYPGWRVEMDGKPGRIFRANSAFMAVAVPKNTRRLIFFFDPATFRTGLLISAAAWAVWAAAAFLVCAMLAWRGKRGNGRANPV